MVLTTNQAVAILEVLDCGVDRVWLGENRVRVENLAGELMEAACDVRITYRGRNPVRLIRGTLQGMVMDRLKRA